MSNPELSARVVSTLVSNHRAFLAFLERRVGSRAIAEDILQEAFARGLTKIDNIEKEEAAVAWFYRLLRNAVIDHHRKQISSDRKLDSFAKELEAAAAPPDEVRAEICRCVGELAETLKPEYAHALKRIELDGVAVKDYANETGISSNNAGVRVFRAREALRRQVKRSCGSCAEHGCLDCSCGSPRVDRLI